VTPVISPEQMRAVFGMDARLAKILTLSTPRLPSLTGALLRR
jgi:hypothetical protein